MLAVALACHCAHAETPLSLMVSETLTYDSNVLKNDRNKYRDAISSTGIQAGFNKEYGRQTYKLSATAVATRYKNTKSYDNDGYNVALGFATQIASNWMVTFDHSRVQQLQSPEDQGVARYRETIVSQDTRIFAQYGLYSRWSVNATLNDSRLDYDVINAYDRKNTAFKLGARYSPTDLLYFDLGYRGTKSDLPSYPVVRRGADNIVRTVIGEKVDRQDLEFSSKWVVTGYSSLDARVAWTNEKYDGDTARDFSGLTGRINWNYTPAGKMRYAIALDRDTNNAGGSTSYFSNDLIYGFNSQKRVSLGVNASATYQATSKIALTTRGNYRRISEERSSVDAAGGTNVLVRDDQLTGNYRSLSFDVSYQLFRSTKLGCSVEKYARSASLFNQAFSGEEVSCNVVFALD